MDSSGIPWPLWQENDRGWSNFLQSEVDLCFCFYLHWTIFTSRSGDRIMPSDQIEKLVPTYPIIFVDHYHTSEKVFAPLWKEAWNMQRLFRDVVEKFLLAIGSPRQFSHQKLVEDNSSGPNVTFGCIGCFFENLRSHVEGSSSYCLKERVIEFLNMPSQAKVC